MFSSLMEIFRFTKIDWPYESLNYRFVQHTVTAKWKEIVSIEFSSLLLFSSSHWTIISSASNSCHLLPHSFPSSSLPVHETTWHTSDISACPPPCSTNTQSLWRDLVSHHHGFYLQKFSIFTSWAPFYFKIFVRLPGRQVTPGRGEGSETAEFRDT